MDRYKLNTVIPSIKELLSDKSLNFHIPNIDLDIPKTFDGRKVWEKYLTPSINQGSCGSCWAFAATSCLADKFNIQSLGNMYVELSPVRLIICYLYNDPNFRNLMGKSNNDESFVLRNIYGLKNLGCFGDTLFNAWNYLYIWGVNTLECSPYKIIADFDNNVSGLPLCTSYFGINADMCYGYKYWEKTGKEIGTPSRFYRCKNYYIIPGVKELGGKIEYIQYIIYKFGPVTMSFIVYEDFYVFNPKTDIYAWNGKGERVGGHAVEVVGWGNRNGREYWIAKNFWGTDWGMNGYFYIEKGTNTCGIEEYAADGAPDFFYPINYDPSSGIPSEGAISRNKRFLVDNESRIMSGGIDPETGYSRRVLRTHPWLDKSSLIDINKLPDFNTWVAGDMHTCNKTGTILIIITTIFVIILTVNYYLR